VADIGGKSVGLGGGATLPLDPKFDFALIQNFTFEFWFRGELIDAGELLGNTSWDSVAQTQTGTTFFNGSKATAVERWAGAAGQLAFARAFTFVPTPGDSLFFAVVSASGTPTLYINGVAYAGTLEANPTDASVMNGPLVLARQVAGEYGELAIYDHALAATQIAAHYTAGQPN